MKNRLSELIKGKRVEKNMSQKEVAEAIGTSLRTYQYYEEGAVTPKEETLAELAKVLDFKLSSIYEDATILHVAEDKEVTKTQPMSFDPMELLYRLTASMEELVKSKVTDSRSIEKMAEAHRIDSENIKELMQMVKASMPARNELQAMQLADPGTEGSTTIKKAP